MPSRLTPSRSFPRAPAFIAFAIAAVAACGSPAPGDGSADDSRAPIDIKPESCGGCKPALPPITAMPASFDMGQVGVFDDPNDGVRQGQVEVVVPTAGTLNAFFSSLTDEWKITSVTWDNGSRPAATVSPFAVSAGDHITIHFEFVASFSDEGGAQSSDLFLNNEGSVLLVPVTATESFFYEGAPVLDAYVSLTCENYGADAAIQLGYITSTCPPVGTISGAPTDLFEFTVSVQNVGGVPVTFSISNPPAPLGIQCGSPQGDGVITIAPGAAPVLMSCQGRAIPGLAGNDFAAQTGLKFPVTVNSSGAGGQTFTFPVDIVATPVTTGGGSSSSSSSSGGGGNGSTCTQSGNTCTATGSDQCLGCMAYCSANGMTPYCSAPLGTFCQPSEAPVPVPKPGYTCAICCGDQCVTDCDVLPPS